jgi:hypothetical protein
MSVRPSGARINLGVVPKVLLAETCAILLPSTPAMTLLSLQRAIRATRWLMQAAGRTQKSMPSLLLSGSPRHCELSLPLL